MLRRLYLDENQLEGEIPNLSALIRLQVLDLGDNNLTGEVPSWLNGLLSLLLLYLNDNQLEGEIPDLSARTALILLDLSGNNLTGEIPDLNALARLQVLYLHDNELEGELPDLTALTILSRLGLGGNHFDFEWSVFETGGKLPLDSGTALTRLYLHESELEGAIPSWLENHAGMQGLWLHGNDIDGGWPVLDGLTELSHLTLPVDDFAPRGRTLRVAGRLPFFLEFDLPADADSTQSFVEWRTPPDLSPETGHLPPHPRVVGIESVAAGSILDVAVVLRDARGEPLAEETPSLAADVCLSVPSSESSTGANQELSLLSHEAEVHGGNDTWRVPEGRDRVPGFSPGAGAVAVCAMTDMLYWFAGAVVDVASGPSAGGGVARISRIEPSIRSATVSADDRIRLSFEVYGRQDIHDNGLADGHTFAWDSENGAGSFEAADRSNANIYTAPASPGTYTLTATSPSGACLGGDDEEERCSAKFIITVRRASIPVEATPEPVNPSGEIPPILTDQDGNQYEVFTPEGGGTFTGDTSTLSAGPGVVPNGEVVGMRISEGDPASNEGSTHQRYTLGGNWYEVSAVDSTGTSVATYVLSGAVEVCVPLPAELRSNISDLALVAVNEDDSFTILSSSVRQSPSGTMNVCGNLGSVPATLAVGKAGAPAPLPIEVEATETSSELPDTGGYAPASSAAWLLILILAAAAATFGTFLIRRKARSSLRE